MNPNGQKVYNSDAEWKIFKRRDNDRNFPYALRAPGCDNHGPNYICRRAGGHRTCYDMATLTDALELADHRANMDGGIVVNNVPAPTTEELEDQLLANKAQKLVIEDLLADIQRLMPHVSATTFQTADQLTATKLNQLREDEE